MKLRASQPENIKKLRILRSLLSAAEDTLRAPENEMDLVSLARQYMSEGWKITDADIISVTRSVVLVELLEAAGKSFDDQ